MVKGLIVNHALLLLVLVLVLIRTFLTALGFKRGIIKVVEQKI